MDTKGSSPKPRRKEALPVEEDALKPEDITGALIVEIAERLGMDVAAGEFYLPKYNSKTKECGCPLTLLTVDKKPEALDDFRLIHDGFHEEFKTHGDFVLSVLPLEQGHIDSFTLGFDLDELDINQDLSAEWYKAGRRVRRELTALGVEM